MKSTKLHNGAIFTAGVDGKWLFTGGWDKSVKVQVRIKENPDATKILQNELSNVADPLLLAFFHP